MSQRDRRLRTAAEFQRVRESAPRGWPHRLLVVYVAPNDLERTRVGITVSGRVGKAVVRNRVRRRVREALRSRVALLPQGKDVLVVARSASARASWPELCQALDQVLGRAAATMRLPTNV
jgi:ribonuclease P protein component